MVALVGSRQRTVPGHANPAWREAERTTNFVWPKQASKRGKVRKENTFSVAYLNKKRRGKS